jgi:PAS domain S-box-containing protein
MIVILAIFFALGILLVSTVIVATNTISSLRAFSTMQTYWLDARKDAIFELIHYVNTGNEQHYENFNESLQFIHDAHDLRLEFIKDSTDYDLVRDLMERIHFNPKDIPSMIVTYERLHTFAHLSDAVRVWEEADQLIDELIDLSLEIRDQIGEEGFNEQKAQYYISRIKVIEYSLQDHKDTVAAGLSDGTRLLRMSIIWLSIFLGVILISSGSFLSWRFLRRIKKWARIVEISEQRYKSLFEHNPNAVFSLDKHEVIVSGNDVFELMSGYPKKDIAYQNFKVLLDPAEREMVEANVAEVLNGDPTDFETVWTKKDGDRITVHLTMLPIYVDKLIEGVFVIAEDISYQKYAERKIKKQLEEKIFLLSEIHDRVKNNLALMSSLLQLQISFIDDSDAQQYLKSTISRIHSIAMVHEKLYQTDNFANIRMDNFIRELIAQIQNRYYRDSDNVQVEIDVDPVTLDIKQAVPSGLILNELIMNSYKFAFNGKNNGKLSVSFNKEGDNVIACVSDNGIGLPEDFDINTNSSLGMTLIKTLTKQLKADMQIQNETGTSISFSFESRKSKKI